MIQKLRRKVILILMGIVTFILFVVFLSVLLTTQSNIRRRSDNMLIQAVSFSPQRGFAPHYDHKGQPDPFPDMPFPPFGRGSLLIADVSENNGVNILLNLLHFIEDEAIEDIIQSAVNDKEYAGYLRHHGIRWLKSSDGKRIAFVDVSIEEEMLKGLIISSLLIGAVTLTIFFFLSLFLSRWAVRPVELAWERQRQFISDASHELKTPLTVILSNAEMLRTFEDNSSEKFSRRIGHIRAEAMRMKELVEDMLTLASSDCTEKYVIHDTIDFSDIVTSSVLTFEPVIFDDRKQLAYNVTEKLFVTGDAQRLQQLVNILLDNACKYTHNNGLIEVTLNSLDYKSLMLTVSNEGDVIPSDEKKRIFLRFYRQDKSRGIKDGFGLGLSIAEGIVREHGGKIWVISGENGKNHFHVTLPTAYKK